MTMTRPCRRMIRHLLQIFFTLGLTFIPGLLINRAAPGVLVSLVPCVPSGPEPGGVSLVPVDDAPAAQVVRAQLDDHPVVGEDPDVVHPHLPADVSQDLVPVVQLHPEE